MERVSPDNSLAKCCCVGGKGDGVGGRRGEERAGSVCLLGWGYITYLKADRNEDMDDEGEGVTIGWRGCL